MTEPSGDAERRRALTLVWRALSRRDHTVAETRSLLERRGIDAAVAYAVIEEVSAAGYLDDAAFARRFAADRRRLDGWGATRIARELDRRGVAPELVEATLGIRSFDDEVQAAGAALARRGVASPLDDGARRRALAFLVRRGYELEVAYEAVRRDEQQRLSATARAPR